MTEDPCCRSHDLAELASRLRPSIRQRREGWPHKRLVVGYRHTWDPSGIRPGGAASVRELPATGGLAGESAGCRSNVERVGSLMREQYERRRVTVAALVSAVLERFASSEGSPRFGF
jgi:hypothetical protein